MSRPSRRFTLLLAFILFSAAAAPPKTSETWTTVRSPNFVVLTNANEKQARQVAYQFEMIRAVFLQFFKIQNPRKDQPVTIIAVRDEQSMKPLLPDYWAKKGSMHPAGLYVGSLEKNYVVLRLDETVSGKALEPFEPIYHEYVHYLTRRSISQLPLWMVEGLAEFYGNTRIEGQKVIVGAPSPVNITVLQTYPPLPLGTLFAVTASSPYYHEENKASIFYAESWALTHYLMTRDWREQTHRTNDFIALLAKNVPAEEAAQRTIGSLAELHTALTLYINRFSFTVARIEAPAEVRPADFQSEVTSEAESLATRADFMALNRHYPQAQAMVEEALKSDPNLAEAHETMGFILSQQGKTAEATKWYAQAVALNSQSCLANYYYAVSLLSGILDDDAAAKAESSLRAAIRIAPEFPAAYSALGWLLARRHKNLDEAHMMAITAVSLEPGEIHYRINAAQVFEMIGESANAVRVATAAASMAKTVEEERQALAVLSEAQQQQEFEKKVQERLAARKKALAQADAAGTNTPGQPEAESGPSGPSARQDSESLAPPPLRHRDEAANGNGPAYPVSIMSGAHSPRPELLPTRQVVEGIIKNVRCLKPSTLEVTLISPSGDIRLYSDNYFKVPYSALDFEPQGVLNPCSDVIAHHARVTYHPAKSQANEGEILEIGLLKK